MRKKGKLEKSERSFRAAYRYVKVGGCLEIGDALFVCRLRDEVIKEKGWLNVLPKDACKGCDLVSMNCNFIACSGFDRGDKNFVWFQKIKK